MSWESEQKILRLCDQAISEENTGNIEPVLRQLRVAISEHLYGVRDNVADLAFLMASENESKAAD